MATNAALGNAVYVCTIIIVTKMHLDVIHALCLNAP